MLGRRSVEGLCQSVVEGVSTKASTALVTKALNDEFHLAGRSHRPQWDNEPTAAYLLEKALDGGGGDLGVRLTLNQPVVAIGAPVEAYMPRVAERLNTHLIIPPHAQVANAVGAVAGGVVQRQRVLISTLDSGDSLRLHLPEGVFDFHDLEEAVAFAERKMVPWVQALAQKAGAEQVEIQVQRQDREVVVKAGWGDRLYLGSELIFTAVGRPSPADRSKA
jgi:N-methylhydantoinase A/oxoprolinase/acetone carboxylase beta subunit